MRKYIMAFILVFTCLSLQAQNNKSFSVLAYYTGDDKQINDFEVEKLTHIIYSLSS